MVVLLHLIGAVACLNSCNYGFHYTATLLVQLKKDSQSQIDAFCSAHACTNQSRGVLASCIKRLLQPLDPLATFTVQIDGKQVEFVWLAGSSLEQTTEMFCNEHNCDEEGGVTIYQHALAMAGKRAAPPAIDLATAVYPIGITPFFKDVHRMSNSTGASPLTMLKITAGGDRSHRAAFFIQRCRCHRRRLRSACSSSPVNNTNTIRMNRNNITTNNRNTCPEAAVNASRQPAAAPSTPRKPRTPQTAWHADDLREHAWLAGYAELQQSMVDGCLPMRALVYQCRQGDL
jgi:hypothetical protein